jgi:Right handed beta helix region
LPARRRFPVTRPGRVTRLSPASFIAAAVVAIACLTCAAVLSVVESPGPDQPRAAGFKPAAMRSPNVVKIVPGRSLSSVHPRAGTTYEFRRGATYTGTLRVSADHVRITNYGRGRYPILSRSTEGSVVVLSGRGDRVAGIRLTGHGYQAVPGCGRARTAGYEVGIDITGSGDTVHSVVVYGNLYAGVFVETAGSHATISGSEFRHVDALNPDDLGSGAFGVLLWGSHNTISRDNFTDQSTCSPDYGQDGSGVEVYHGSANLIEHCTGRNDSDFTELGGAGARNNRYVDNRFAAPGEFLVTRGSGDKVDGPVRNTTMIGDVAHGRVVSYDWRPGDGTLLTMKRSHVGSLSVDGGYVNGGDNIVGF